MPVPRCSIEQLVPEDGPATGERIAATGRRQKPSDRGNRPGASEQRGLHSGGDPVIGEVVDGKSGPIAPGRVAGFAKDRLGGSPTTAHGLRDPLSLQRVDETSGIADE